MLLLREFLSPAERDNLFAWICAGRWTFAPSTVTREGVREQDESYRKSHICYDFAPWHDIFVTKMTAHMPLFIDRLGIDRFELGQIECQLTHTGDGGFFRVHNDNSDPLSRLRVLTFVYYIHRVPKVFDGGELVFRDGPILVPEDNTLVVFPSHLMHEVKPVRCASDEFVYGRMTVNGWLRRVPAPLES
jgi:Rps23 Pro-64 3,4-dihydroxylase Tpa1-like proline 4-hydroxylase